MSRPVRIIKNPTHETTPMNVRSTTSSVSASHSMHANSQNPYRSSTSEQFERPTRIINSSNNVSANVPTNVPTTSRAKDESRPATPVIHSPTEQAERPTRIINGPQVADTPQADRRDPTNPWQNKKPIKNDNVDDNVTAISKPITEDTNIDIVNEPEVPEVSARPIRTNPTSQHRVTQLIQNNKKSDPNSLSAITDYIREEIKKQCNKNIPQTYYDYNNYVLFKKKFDMVAEKWEKMMDYIMANCKKLDNQYMKYKYCGIKGKIVQAIFNIAYSYIIIGADAVSGDGIDNFIDNSISTKYNTLLGKPATLSAFIKISGTSKEAELFSTNNTFDVDKLIKISSKIRKLTIREKICIFFASLQKKLPIIFVLYEAVLQIKNDLDILVDRFEQKESWIVGNNIKLKEHNTTISTLQKKINDVKTRKQEAAAKLGLIKYNDTENEKSTYDKREVIELRKIMNIDTTADEDEIAKQTKICDEIKKFNDKYIEENKIDANEISTYRKSIKEKIAEYHTELNFFNFLDFTYWMHTCGMNFEDDNFCERDSIHWPIIKELLKSATQTELDTIYTRKIEYSITDSDRSDIWNKYYSKESGPCFGCGSTIFKTSFKFGPFVEFTNTGGTTCREPKPLCTVCASNHKRFAYA